MKNLVKESLKVQFFKDKDKVINDYLETTDVFKVCEYTSGKKVIINNLNNKAYSRNGFLFSVILKDENYIEELNQEEMLEYLNAEYSAKYEDQEVDLDIEIEED